MREALERMIREHLIKGNFIYIVVSSFIGLMLMPLPASAHGGAHMIFSITSPAFEDEGGIPPGYTCEGKDISPALVFAGAPDGTKSLVLIVADPDAPDPAAPGMTWVHWVLYNLPANTTGLEENVRTLPAGTMEGTNNWHKTGYGGPCPPIGRHRYFFKLYALDTVLFGLHDPTMTVLEEAMHGHVLAKTKLIGMYQKK